MILFYMWLKIGDDVVGFSAMKFGPYEIDIMNIVAPASEASSSYNTYSNLNMLEANFVFYIPVFNNMKQAFEAIKGALTE